MTLDCTGQEDEQIRSSFGKHIVQNQRTLTQRYDIDQAQGTIVEHYISDGNNNWVEKPQTHKAFFSPRGVAAWCRFDDCENGGTSADNGKTVKFTGSTIVDTQRMKAMAWDSMTSNGNDGSWITGTSSMLSICTKVAP